MTKEKKPSSKNHDNNKKPAGKCKFSEKLCKTIPCSRFFIATLFLLIGIAAYSPTK